MAAWTDRLGFYLGGLHFAFCYRPACGNLEFRCRSFGSNNICFYAFLLPPSAVVPVHAVVESFSALSRVVLLREYVDWSYAAYFAIGGLAGFLIGAPTFYRLSITDDLLRAVLGCAILLVTWIRLPYLSDKRWKQTSLFGGMLTSCVTIFVGATSPLVAALVQQRHPDHRITLATSAVCMVAQHSGKIVVFGLIGFSFVQYTDLILSLIIASLIGSWIGRYILIKLPEKLCKLALKTIVTTLALNLIWSGVWPS